MAWVEKDHNTHPAPTPCCVQGRQPAAQAAQSHIQPGLECLQGWGIHSLLGQPDQCVTTLWGKNFLLNSCQSNSRISCRSLSLLLLFRSSLPWRLVDLKLSWLLQNIWMALSVFLLPSTPACHNAHSGFFQTPWRRHLHHILQWNSGIPTISSYLTPRPLLQP